MAHGSAAILAYVSPIEANAAKRQQAEETTQREGKFALYRNLKSWGINTPEKGLTHDELAERELGYSRPDAERGVTLTGKALQEHVNGLPTEQRRDWNIWFRKVEDRKTELRTKAHEYKRSSRFTPAQWSEFGSKEVTAAGKRSRWVWYLREGIDYSAYALRPDLPGDEDEAAE